MTFPANIWTKSNNLRRETEQAANGKVETVA
jgi:hypothetical protein